MLDPAPFEPSSQDPALLAALRLVRLAGLLVPEPDREGWRAEWRAELITRHRELEERQAGVASRLGLVRRALGAFVDGLYLLMHGFSATHVVSDLPHAFRSLRKRPGFTLVAVFTLGLGIGANTALFGVVRGVILRPFGYHEPDRLVHVLGHHQGEPPGSGNVSYPNLHDLERRSSTLAGVAGLAHWRPALTDGGDPLVVVGATVSWDYFDVLGVRPSLGRFFRPEDEGEGREPVVVIGHRLWVERFGADDRVVGRSIAIDNTPYRVRGVAGRGFEGPHLVSFEGEQPQVWRTPWFDAPDWYRSGRSWRGVARVADGIGLDAARTEISTLMAELAEEWPEFNAKREVALLPLHDSVVGESRSALLLLFGAVGLVLLVACVNVASLLLGRGLERYDELLVRAALGASHGRLTAHLLAESLALAALGGALGVALAYAGTGTLVRLAGPWIPRPEAVAVDGAVLLFAAATAIGTGVLFGLFPALRLLRGARLAGLSGGRTGGTLARRAGRARRALVLAQIAATVVLVTGAGLLVKSLRNLYRVELGVEREGVLTVGLHGVAWNGLEPPEATARYRELFERVEALPGVRIAGAIDVLPLSDNYSCDGVIPTDRPPPPPGEGRCAEVRSATPGILDALGVPLLEGRGIEWRDGPESVGVAVISRRTAESFWPGQRALGKRAVIHGDTFSVVGVAADIRPFGPEREVQPMVFLPATQEPWNGITRGLSMVARGDETIEHAGAAVRRAIQSVSPSIPVFEVRTLDRMLSERTGGPRFRTALLGGFATLALLLALVGIGGVMTHSVVRRRREIGVRIALGADPGDVTRAVLAEGIRLTTFGLALGLGAALLFTRLLRSQMFQVSPLDPAVLATACGLVVLLGAISSWLPARRAARVDPVVALRAD